MATIDLGKIKIVWRGTYSGGTAYTPDDAVVSSGTSYICIANTTGNAPPNGTYWNVLAQAGTNGTNGTDLTSTLTTQGDILYRDGSGLQRLPKGTAGQVLQMNSGATAPEYGTVSSDFVRITTNTLSSATTTWTIDNVFSTTYQNYIIKLNLRTGDNGHNIIFRYLNNSGAEVGDTNYRGGGGGLENTSSGANNAQAVHNWDANGHSLTGFGDTLGNIGTPNAVNLTATINIAYPNVSSGMGFAGKSFNGLVNYTGSSGGRVLVGYLGGYFDANLQARGFNIVSTTGNGIGANSMLAVYGLKS